MTRTIAIYGKGGVGKTTIAANLAAALALSGKRVLLIGCSPTVDSCRLLLGDEVSVTLSDLLAIKGEAISERMLSRGYQGVRCLEIGEITGICGCSSQGIMSALNSFYESKVIESLAVDFVIYDMPGDLGCIAELFFEQSKADLSIIVTSADFQSIYAANRLISIVASAPVKSFITLIVNGNFSTFEDSLVGHYAKQVGLNLAAAVPRSYAVRHSELYGKTVVEAGPLSSHANIYRNLARQLSEGGIYRNRQSIKPLDSVQLKEWAHEWGRRIGELEFGILSEGAGI